MKRNIYTKSKIVIMLAIMLLPLSGLRAQWTNIHNGVNIFDIDAVDDATWFMSQYYVLKKTTDYGATWNTVIPYLTQNNIEEMYFLDENTFWVVGYDNSSGIQGWVSRTTDGGVSFQNVTTSSTYSYLTGVFFTSAGTGYVTSYGGKILKSTDGGASWNPSFMTNTTPLRRIKFVNANVGMAVGDNGIAILTTNAGTSWSTLNTGATGNLNDLELISASDFIVAGADGIFRSTNGGANWLQVSSHAIDRLDFPTTTDGFAGGNSYMYKTTDGGASWMGVNSPVSSYFTSVFFMTSQHGYVSSPVGIWETTNGASDCPTVNAGADQHVCGPTTMLNAIASANNSYSYVWSPAAGLSNPFGSLTSANTPNPNQIVTVQYVVTMIDTVYGCPSVTDTVNVTYDTLQFIPNYLQVTNLIDLCEGDSIVLDPGSGGASYQWFGPGGNYTTQTITVDTTTNWAVMVYNCVGVPVTYQFMVSLTPCDSVWPGDASDDGYANMYDLLNVGVAFGATGASRPDQSIGWYAHFANPWAGNFNSIGGNFKHADSDGNGIVDYADTTAIIVNYGNNHPLTPVPVPGPNDPPMYFGNIPTEIEEGDIVTISIFLGTSAMPVTNFYGGAFSVNYDSTFIQPNSVSISFNPSWVGSTGTNAVSLSKNLPADQRVDAAICRNNQTPISGFGEFAQLHIIMQDDIVALVEGQVQQLLLDALMNLTFSNEKFIDHQENLLLINPVPADINVITGIDEATPMYIYMYPNPASDYLVMESPDTRIEQVQFINVQGATVKMVRNISEVSATVNTADLKPGVYFVNVKVENGGFSIHKLIIR